MEPSLSVKGSELKRNQSKRALVESVQGGFFLRKKPLGGVASGYCYSGFAVAPAARGKRVSKLAETAVVLWRGSRTTMKKLLKSYFYWTCLLYTSRCV